MFEIAPDEWKTFAFTQEDVEKKTEKFVVFARRFVRMSDMAVDMLGPDMDILSEQLADLGVAHKHYGVFQLHYDLMGKSLVHTLSVILSRHSCTDASNDAWGKVFKFMSTAMLHGADSA